MSPRFEARKGRTSLDKGLPLSTQPFVSHSGLFLKKDLNVAERQHCQRRGTIRAVAGGRSRIDLVIKGAGSEHEFGNPVAPNGTRQTHDPKRAESVQLGGTETSHLQVAVPGWSIGCQGQTGEIRLS